MPYALHPAPYALRPAPFALVNLRRLKFFETRDESLCTREDAVVEPLLGRDGAVRYEAERFVMHRCHRGVEGVVCALEGI